MSKTRVREKRVICGPRYMDVDIYQITERQYKAARAKRYNASRPQQQKLNDKNARRYFRQKVITNYTEDDYVITHTFDDEHLPKTIDDAIRIYKNYLARINYQCRIRGIPLCKYMSVLEHTEPEGKRKGIRFHFHSFFSCELPPKILKQLWSSGRGKSKKRMGLVKIDTIDFLDDSIEGLCEYMLKNPVGKKRWMQSKGLKEPKFPKPADNKYKRRTFERSAKEGDFYDKEYVRKKYPGWECSDSTVEYNELTGWAVYLKMRRIE